jgi:hypothetical protein
MRGSHMQAAIPGKIAVPAFSDTVDFAKAPSRWLVFTAAGNVSVLPADDPTPVTIAVTAGMKLDIAVKRVRSTGTTVGAGTIIAGC